MLSPGENTVDAHHLVGMDASPDRDTDAALVTACLEQISTRGWSRLSIPLAARNAGIPLDIARRHLPDRYALLLRFGAMADAFALKDSPNDGPARDRLFDLVMRRIDFLQQHRAGGIALLRAVPFDPLAVLLVASANLRSMSWLLETAGISATGPKGGLRVAGLIAIWGWTVRAWERDDSEDMAATMATLDAALGRAERAANWLDTGSTAELALTPACPTQKE